MRIARLARELGCGDFVKIEIMRDSKYLLPDNAETIKPRRSWPREGFIVLPYMYPDLNVARDLASAGAAAIMPLGAPIGSNKGLATRDFIQILIDEMDLPVIVDAGIGRPSQACEAMEMGAAAIMANTALATAGDLPLMAAAFRQAIEAGRKAYLSGLGRVLVRGAARLGPPHGLPPRLRGRAHGKPILCGPPRPSPPAALEKKHRLESDPAFRKSHMEYLPGMEVLDSDLKDRVLAEMQAYDYTRYNRRGREGRPGARHLLLEDFKALLSPAAAPFLEEMARKPTGRPRSTSATPSTSSPPCTSPTTARTTASTAASTATTTSSG